MESVSRKRKRCHVYEKEEEEEENEEEKIERFFKLIKSIREARERLLLKESDDHVLIKDSSSEIDKMRKKKLPVVYEKQKAAVWMPCFQLEDFMEDHEAHHFNTSLLPLVSTPSHQLQGSSKDKMEGLDLNPSL